jgi:hypothetical protein
VTVGAADLRGINEGSAVQGELDECPEEGARELDDTAIAAEEVVGIVVSMVAERAGVVGLGVPLGLVREQNGLASSSRGQGM